uniref:Ig-like domain-containing protein n=1 Tax=Chelydra serpentina TaxID=8475 RepID=A0A8C3TC44_CHESE
WSSRGPSVFPLVPCCTQTGNAPPDTSLACLVTGYFPAPVHIKWNSGQVTEEVKTFPEVTMSDGLLTQSSLLINPASSRQGNTYQCEVRHEGTAKWAEMAPKPHAGPSVPGKTSASCLLPQPTQPNPNLTALLPHPYPTQENKDNSPLPAKAQLCSHKDSKQTQCSSEHRVPATRGPSSVQLAGWGAPPLFPLVTFPASFLGLLPDPHLEISPQVLSSALMCGSTMPPQVHLLVPSCEDSSTESQLELVCLLLSFKLDKADVKWLVNGKERSPPTPAFSSAKGTDGFYMGQSRMNVTRESWEKGDIYTCQVTDPAVRKELSMRNTSKCLGEGLRP